MMSSDELVRVDQVKKIYRDRQKVPCTKCRYCMPCPVGVDIPGNLEAYNNYYLFDSEGNRMLAKMFYGTMLADGAKADNCIECGKCIEHCPQEIQIPQELKKVAEVLGTAAN